MHFSQVIISYFCDKRFEYYNCPTISTVLDFIQGDCKIVLLSGEKDQIFRKKIMQRLKILGYGFLAIGKFLKFSYAMNFQFLFQRIIDIKYIKFYFFTSCL